ncbi:DinB family protein [Jatrophihabitans endophyticus]|uniref:DinB family protein n=1 Tax=Jatrophihabitans endophyticus TaxID=1206085 RepID=UPI0019EF7FFC|nr:DinB family protein [Jatrophihabitans endophyticus]MBE7188005.1 DinB family protein [Jatrophihabitans endophyticus]
MTTFGGERGTLLRYLDQYRTTLTHKCADLDAEQLARRSVPPSTLSLLGLVRHMAEVERSWFRRLSGEDAAGIYYTEDDVDGDFDGAVADDEVVADAFRSWHAEIAFADRFLADHPDLGFETTTPNGRHVQLRDVLVHLVEEYARHCGHADLLRETIDGRVGE